MARRATDISYTNGIGSTRLASPEPNNLPPKKSYKEPYPNTVISIGAIAFGNCSEDAIVAFSSKQPPTIEPFTFSKTVELHVPKGCRDIYKKTEGWKNLNIIDDLG